MNQFAVFDSVINAQNCISEIDRIKKFPGTWANPIEHPADARCLVPVDWNQLQGCENLLAKCEIISRSDAMQRGWYFGPFIGKLAREKGKMEDVHFLFDALIEAYGKPNFPAFRSLVLSFLSACYALKESLRTKSKNKAFKSALGSWWNDRARDLNRKNELLHSFEQFMNNEKHGGALANQHSKIYLSPRAYISELIITHAPVGVDISTLNISAEGAFAWAFRGSAMERRFPVGIHTARYEVSVDNPPSSHLGHSIAGASLLNMLQLIRDYYANLLFSAVSLLGEDHKLPTIKFEGDANMGIEYSLKSK
jgi:hypothetical protein